MRLRAVARWKDLRAALTTMPGGGIWLRCALVYAIFLACAAPIGLWFGLLHPGMPHLRPADMASGGVLLLVQPAFVEEVVFRGLLLPREASSLSRGRVVFMAGVALALYVASHPVNAALFRPQLLRLFASPVYLTLTTLLGLTCTAAYVISRSIWPPVAIHWLTVVMWIWFLGGQALLC